MCYAWHKQARSKELSPADIKLIFSDKILGGSIQIINLTGGEPTIRKDSIEIIDTLASTCRNLRRIDISTNGINTEEVVDVIEQALALTLRHNVNLGVGVSVDGIGMVHDRMRGVEGAFEKINRTIDELTELKGLYPSSGLGLNFTITKDNYTNLREAFDYARRRNIGMNFTPAALSEIGVESMRVKDSFFLPEESRKGISDFVRFLAQDRYIHPEYAEFLMHWLDLGERKGPCAFRNGESLLCEPDGSLYCCGNFRDFKMGNVLEKSFSELMRQRKDFSAFYKQRCRRCNSNCYIQEAKRTNS
jgi:MoaA/NifB/PqqE/SkfB family radical SAM enzyme